MKEEQEVEGRGFRSPAKLTKKNYTLTTRPKKGKKT